MSNKKNDVKGKIIVIGIGLITLTLLIAFVANSFSSEDHNTTTEKVVVSETGEASNINFKVPTKKKIDNDSLSLLEKFDAYKRDSIAKSKADNINLNNGSTLNASTLFSGTGNSENNLNSRLSGDDSSKSAAEEKPSNETNMMASNTNTSKTSYRSSGSSNYSGSRNRVRRPVKVENNVNINDFFTQKSNNNNRNSNSKSKSTNSDEFIYAVIHKDQKIKNNGRIKFRLTKPAIINDKIYKANTYVFGFAQFSENRINVEITNIDNEPLNLYAYDKQDGNIGLYVEGANALGELGQESRDDMAQDINVSGIPLGNTVKSLFRKKNKEISVFLLNNYEVILKTTK